MSDLDPLPQPARIVRASFKASQAKEVANLLGRSVMDKVVLSLLAATLGVNAIADDFLFVGCWWLFFGLAHASIAVVTYIDHRKAKRLHADLTAITDHYAINRAVLPWPKED